MHFNGYQADFHESRAGPVPPPAPQRTAEVDDNILPNCTICKNFFRGVKNGDVNLGRKIDVFRDIYLFKWIRQEAKNNGIC